MNRENIVPGNLCIMKANARYQQKAGITNWDRYYKAGQLLFKSGAIIPK